MKKCLFIVMLFFKTYGSYAQYATDTMSVCDKIIALSTVWSSAKQNFANFDLTPVDWDSAYKATIPAVLAAKDADAVYKEMAKMVALLKDGHTAVYHRSAFIEKRPPLQTEWIEGKVIITRIDNDSLINHYNLQVGDEIISIDKMAVKDYVDKNITGYQFASTPQDLAVKTYSHALLYGDADTPVTLGCVKKDGTKFSSSIRRNMQANINRPYFSLKIVESNIALLSLYDFQNNDYKNLFDSLYKLILPAKAIIIDVRRHTGGNAAQGNYILSHFIDKNTTGAKSKTKQYLAAFAAWGRQPMWMEFEPSVVKPIEGKEKFLKPMVVLTGAQSYSAAEDFCVGFDVSGRGIKMGQPTAGSTGQPLRIDLPGNGIAMICTKRDVYPNGKEFIGIGIQPDILVEEKAEDFANGKDRVIEKAIAHLQQQLNSSK